MTFVCPEWKIEKVIDFAAEAGYDGVELRVDEGHKHGISSSSTEVEREYAKRLFHEKGVEASCIATSVQFGFADHEKRKSNIRSAKLNVELAGDLGAKVVRIFAGGDIPKLSQEAADYIAEAFTEVGDYAKQYGVCPMLETLHDIVKSSEDAVEVLKRVKSSNFGILWNHSEIDQRSFNLLKDHIKHFHVHDEVLNPENENILHLAKMMKSVGFDGYVSLEIIKGYNLPENLLIETAKKLKGYIAQA
ncbi:MAG: sugar phosphate isomerase/epimerase family protein [Thermoproteota archaeon]